MSENVREDEVTQERRTARVGTVSGLALMTGATAMAAVGGGHHSVFATVLLGLLALGMAHAFTVEIRRQAHRRSNGRWGRPDLINIALLAGWAVVSLTIAAFPFPSSPVRVLALLLTASYATACAYFVVERRRAASVVLPPTPSMTESSRV
ncbi:hypothetical protein [Actinoplanes siamensis]|uniref:Uncharacterized protein n=1 Tax=Actinoplanes siamensis TaxID=1223317 RepID=A0A919TPE1_9ACTN|nr:hypothetical protein [Actinoplanes siamensis]GIF08815.1 hypothetical protein Asi03nite_63530 [Actinoplanes siamensis]